MTIPKSATRRSQLFTPRGEIGKQQRRDREYSRRDLAKRVRELTGRVR